MGSRFLDLPLEIRLAVYEGLLADYRAIERAKQPDNAHLLLLRVSKQVSAECERQYHVSSLNECIAKLTNLRTLRVFDAYRAVNLNTAYGLTRILGSRVHWSFEPAMFLPGPPPQLSAYQMFLTSNQPFALFQLACPQPLRSLHLTGNMSLVDTDLPALRHLSLVGVTSTFFDRNLQGLFATSPMETFVYDYGTARVPSFEMHDTFLKEVLHPHGATLRHLVLLMCSKVTTAALQNCVAQLARLEYFALSFITTREFDSAFVGVLPSTLGVFKIAVKSGKYQPSLNNEEESLCDAIEHSLMAREPPPRSIAVDLREAILRERMTRWAATARHRRIHLHIGRWTVATDELGKPCD
ncbi:hypothetical protein HDZ31DRAFT_85943 [Schizophyllum fasciatum]